MRLYDGGIIFLLLLGGFVYLYSYEDIRETNEKRVEEKNIQVQDQNFEREFKATRIERATCETEITQYYRDKHTGGWVKTCKGRLLEEGEVTRVVRKDNL
jgi:hypothetical protein